MCVSVSAASTLLNDNRGISGEGSEGDVRYYGTQCPYLGRGLTVELETLEGDVRSLKFESALLIILHACFCWR